MATLSEQLDGALASWGELGEVVLDTGFEYGDGEHVRITLRKRGNRLGQASRAVYEDLLELDA